MDKIHEILRKRFGYDTFRPLQEDIIRHVMAGGDALALMPTGGGKSLCYQIPALALEGTAVVVSPLISLMKDQVDALRANGVAAAALHSNRSEAENRATQEECGRGALKILYVSPERLLGDLRWLRESVRVSLIAVDEAHCISQWGHDFRPEYTQLGRLRAEFPGTPVLALTATADKVTRDDILEQLGLAGARLFVASFDRPNLSLEVRRGCPDSDKLRAIEGLADAWRGESGIVYCLSRKTTERVAERLRERGVRAEAYHAGMDAANRDRVQADFSGDRLQVVCATVAFGMGIDKSNVRFVVHYNLPKSIESYYQEIGRAGRDGLPSDTLLFYGLQDLVTLRKFAEESAQPAINLEKLARMREYAEAQVCRRRILLNYFGEPTATGCGNCDVCRTPPRLFDGTQLTQKALCAILRAGEGAGLTTVAEILRGTPSQAVVSRGYDRLRTYGAGRDVPFLHWRDYLLQMLQLGFIEIDYKDDLHLRVTPLGHDVVRGLMEARLATPLDEERRSAARRRGPREERPAAPGGEDKALLEKLRQLRRDMAAERNAPAFTVMNDRTLHDLAANKPLSVEAFGQTHGIGEYKMTAFGPRFVALIRSHLGLEP